MNGAHAQARMRARTHTHTDAAFHLSRATHDPPAHGQQNAILAAEGHCQHHEWCTCTHTHKHTYTQSSTSQPPLMTHPHMGPTVSTHALSFHL